MSTRHTSWFATSTPLYETYDANIMLFHMLDGIIVSLSICEMMITVLLADTGLNISFLRMLRLLRLLRLLKAWKGLFRIVMAFMHAIPQIANLFILMLLLMFIFAPPIFSPPT